MSDIVGKIVSFHATRIMWGNPVKGVVKRISGEWITVELLKDIEGIRNAWYKGEDKDFRLCLIDGPIIIHDAEQQPCNNCQNGCPACAGYGYINVSKEW